MDGLMFIPKNFASQFDPSTEIEFAAWNISYSRGTTVHFVFFLFSSVQMEYYLEFQKIQSIVSLFSQFFWNVNLVKLSSNDQSTKEF